QRDTASGEHSTEWPVSCEGRSLDLDEGRAEAARRRTDLGRRITPRRPALPALVVVSAALDHVRRALHRTGRVADEGRAAVILGVPVAAILPDVSVHVIQAQVVRLVRRHLAGAPEGLAGL